MTNLVLDTVYRCNSEPYGGRIDVSMVSIEVFGAGTTVDIYVSNDVDEPADYTEMTLDTAGVDGINPFYGIPKWILFKTATGTPVIKENNLIRVRP